MQFSRSRPMSGLRLIAKASARPVSVGIDLDRVHHAPPFGIRFNFNPTTPSHLITRIEASTRMNFLFQSRSLHVAMSSSNFPDNQHAAYPLRFFDKLPIIRLMSPQKVIRLKYHVFPSPLQRHVKRTGKRYPAFHADQSFLAGQASRKDCI